MNKKELDIDNWNRREHFNFFRKFDDPYFSLTQLVDCTYAWKQCKSEGHSFFMYYLHQALKAANQTECFRYRIEGETIWIYDQVHASSTVGRPDGTFSFSFIEYAEDFSSFNTAARLVIEQMIASTGINFDNDSQRPDVLHCTSLPWLQFTGLTHPRTYTKDAGIPKLSFGKCAENNGKWQMPVSVLAHHGLMDGFHVAAFIKQFEEGMGG